MKAQAALLAVVLSLPATGWATDRYVKTPAGGCSTPVDIDFNPATESCGSGSELVYDSVSAAVSAHAGGDNIYVLGGAYSVDIQNTLLSGPSVDQKTKLWSYNGQTVTFLTPTAAASGNGIAISSRSNISIKQIIVDNTDVVAPNGKRGFPFRITGSIASPAANIDLDGVRATNGGIGMFTAHVNNLHVTRSRFDHNGHDDKDHGIYTDNGTNDAIIEYSEFDHNAQMGAQLYKFPSRMIFRRNYVHDNCAITHSGSSVYLSGVDNLLDRNVVWSNGDCTTGITVSTGSSTPPTRNTLKQNALYCSTGTCTNGLNIANASVTNTRLENNVSLGHANNIRNIGTGTVLAGNVTAGPATDYWTNPAAGDLTLKAGSAAIDGGTNVGEAFCGSNPDQGAFEKPVVTAATINGNTLDVTVCTAAPPMQPVGTWTPACTGTGCGTPVSSSISVTGGGVVRITVGGISGGACAAGQTWTIAASGPNADSVLVGNQWNQSLHTVTNFAVDSSACDGSGGPGFPAGATAIYNFENNLNDSSGNANHAIGSANIAYAAAHDMQGVQFTNGVDSYVDTGLLSGHNPSTSHLVVAFGIRINAADLGVRRLVAGVTLGTNQRFYIRRDSDNIWDFSTQAVSSPVNTEFPVVAGDTHVCVKFNPTTDTATLYINGQTGTISGASVQNYTSYTFPSTFRFGLPPTDFTVAQSPPDIIDQAYIYTTDVSCVDIYNAWQPPLTSTTMAQVAHQWQGVYLSNGSPENRGAVNEQRTVVKGGAAALVVQLNCEGGDCVVLQPRFRYNVNGGAFNSVVPDSPTADGVSYWGSDVASILNSGEAGGPLSGSLAHTNGITALTSVATPTIDQGNNTSYTMRGIFRIDAPMPDPNTPPRVCFKVYDQSGEPMASYAPAEGACLTQKNATASGGP